MTYAEDVGLAVMVDLGWPWWVTTVIAVCVVAAAAVLYLVNRDPAVRAVAAVLAVEGVVIALVAPFVMDDGGSSAAAMRTSRSDGSAMTAAAKPLSHAAFVRRADASCAQLNKEAGALGASPSPKNLPAMAHYLDRFAPLLHAALRRQAANARAAPRAEHGTTLAWMHAMNAIGNAVQGARESAKAGDRRGVTAAFAASDAASTRSAALSKRLGLKVCFS